MLASLRWRQKARFFSNDASQKVRTLKPFFTAQTYKCVHSEVGGISVLFPWRNPPLHFCERNRFLLYSEGETFCLFQEPVCDRFTIWFSIFSKKMWWLIGSAPDFLGLPGFESGTSHNDCDALQDHCVL